MTADGADDVVPFDTARERWFHASCGRDFCGAAITGRSLDGGAPHWWHSTDIIDNDHQADHPGDPTRFADDYPRMAPRDGRRDFEDGRLWAEYHQARFQRVTRGRRFNPKAEPGDWGRAAEIAETFHRFAATPQTKDIEP